MKKRQNFLSSRVTVAQIQTISLIYVILFILFSNSSSTTTPLWQPIVLIFQLSVQPETLPPKCYDWSSYSKIHHVV